MTPNRIFNEHARCYSDPIYFIDTYCQILDATEGEWIPFKLWPAQRETLECIVNHQLVIILKARQLGLTWLLLAYALWKMIYHPVAVVLLFSRRDTEAIYLLGDERLKGMYSRLPEWMRGRDESTLDSAHAWQLNGASVARAFPTSAGDSYTASLAIVDEADLVPDLDRLMSAVKPTIDGGGQMVLLSRSNKSRPQSEFKRIYNGAKDGSNSWASVFLPWHARPDRDTEWYERQRIDSEINTGSLDELYQQYPATDLEALSPRSLDKRIAPAWLRQCYVPERGQEFDSKPAVNGLVTFREPEPGGRYVIGVDPAEGNPTSDDSAMTVMDADTGEEVAKLAGKFEPSVIAGHTDTIGCYYNDAAVMVERNNHGHAVILWLQDNSKLRLLEGWDKAGKKRKVGWLSNSKGKTLLYDATANAFKDEQTIVHSFDTYTQLASIEGSTLLAPEGMPDDKADSYALALVGVPRAKQKAVPAKAKSGRIEW